MGKEKKHSKKDKASGDVLDMAHLSLKKFRKVTKQISKLSTGQKVVGGVALLAMGLTYLAQQQAEEPSRSPGPDDTTEPSAAPAPRRHKKLSAASDKA